MTEAVNRLVGVFIFMCIFVCTQVGSRRKGVRIWHGMRGRGRWAPDTAPIFTNTNSNSCHSYRQLSTHTGKKNINGNYSAKRSLKISTLTSRKYLPVGTAQSWGLLQKRQNVSIPAKLIYPGIFRLLPAETSICSQAGFL